jgi:DNA-binding response OmpR family regulator
MTPDVSLDHGAWIGLARFRIGRRRPAAARSRVVDYVAALCDASANSLNSPVTTNTPCSAMSTVLSPIRSRQRATRARRGRLRDQLDHDRHRRGGRSTSSASAGESCDQVVYNLVTTWPAVSGRLSVVTERSTPEVLRSGVLEARPSECLVLAGGRVLMLSRRELQLLAAMMRNEGRILSREKLYALAWGKRLRPGDRTVDVFVRKLRVRLAQEVPKWSFIHTHFGLGYRFAPESSRNANNRVTTS